MKRVYFINKLKRINSLNDALEQHKQRNFITWLANKWPFNLQSFSLCRFSFLTKECIYQYLERKNCSHIIVYHTSILESWRFLLRWRRCCGSQPEKKRRFTTPTELEDDNQEPFSDHFKLKFVNWHRRANCQRPGDLEEKCTDYGTFKAILQNAEHLKVTVITFYSTGSYCSGHYSTFHVALSLNSFRAAYC